MFKSLEFLVGQKVNVDDVVRTLVAFGYARATKVFKEGEFALRGGVLDVYPAHFEVPLRLDLEDDTIRAIHGFDPATAAPIDEHAIVIVAPFKTSSQSVFSAEVPLNNFVDIEQGDYVVHNNHGIGRFIGIKEFDLTAQKKEHLVIEYKDGDKLFVPKHDVHLVQKYVSFTKRPARLHKLGGKEWLATRRAVEKKLKALAAEMLRTQALRAQLAGFAFTKDNEWQKEFEGRFPYKETPDQLKATLETKVDMESPRPMDRLICGDVGYGKTEVAMRAAFKAVMDNKQVALLVPTTILAEQHYYNFTKRLEGFPVKVGMLSRFRTKHEQQMIVKEAAEGKVDILIGTHRLLSKDVAFKDLGLVIIDEEQRFGVRSKEKLKHFRLLADVMTLTATPIPRTLYMALAGARDMSVISSPPTNRLAVKTQMIPFDEDLIHDAIERELARGGQVFFLHNRVENIETIAEGIRKLVPHARLGIAHGQMSARFLEEIMLKFLKKEIDVLVCTTIIESGIDVPLANTLIVNRADKFGLADLHQLRGRVGRLDVQAYAYFIVPRRESQSEIARQRLKAIEKHSDLGAGFHIAFEDLQIRGAGNLLGSQQHGFIASIGFDLYCRLLKESIEHLRKEV
ncbi:MAG: transcription-repair coupling factor [Candidatus Omnitrophica bacterium]|nr:transcription-repair coupling factor [Candidatus Omnitrophota bacterium]MDE2008822.1 transcription-repair coupling factor [Candidatus Omnitrophota bacterium]MDE2213615.1 transcription-repair coupling factor [Candidatus Omnitrophota bacterium]MDE2230484.1 transcription-repair coupling factor [Candidatus Omnitrophota bacterium]